MLTGITKNIPIIVFQMGYKEKDVCDHAGKAIKAGSKSGVQILLEYVCKQFSSFHFINNIVSTLLVSFFYFLRQFNTKYTISANNF